VEYYWYDAETGGVPDSGSPEDTHVCTAPDEWWVEVRYKDKVFEPRFKIVVRAYLPPTPGSIADDQTICYGEVPAKFTSAEAASGGRGATTYQWQNSTDNGANWNNISGAESEDYTPSGILTETTQYRRSVTNDCGTVYTDSVTVTVRPKSLFDYPDIRIRICPDAGKTVNLSKYVDTLSLNTIVWESVSPHVPIDATSGTISTDNLKTSSLYTFTYTVGNPCATNITRKVYLETLKPGRMRPLRNSVVICYLYAEALQINQLFGIEADGTWSYSADGGNIKSHIFESTSPNHGGAVVINGKAVYEDILIPSFSYHGKSAKRVTITYTPAAPDSCLAGKSYSITIILTSDIMN
jgi:hypothetical protein